MRGGVEVWLSRGVSMDSPVEWDMAERRFRVRLSWWRALDLYHRNTVLRRMAGVLGVDTVVVRAPRCQRGAERPRAA